MAEMAMLRWVQEAIATSRSGGPVRGYHPGKFFEILDANSSFLAHFHPEN